MPVESGMMPATTPELCKNPNDGATEWKTVAEVPELAVLLEHLRAVLSDGAAHGLLKVVR